MSAIVEIETIEQSEKLRWMPIARFAGPRELNQALAMAGDLSTRVTGPAPRTRVVDRTGLVIAEFPAS